MKAYYYETMVYGDSGLDFAHGFKYTIKEVFIPDKNIILNNKGFVFAADKPRNDKYDVMNIDDDLVQRLFEFMKTTNLITNFFKGL